MKYISRNIRWVFTNALVFLLVMMLLRIIFYIIFSHPANESVTSAFIMGFRYDIRVVAIPSLVIWLLSCIPLFNPFIKKPALKGWIIFYLIWVLITFLFYMADFGHYAYLHQRLNASVLSYLNDPGISSRMVWQSYPVIWWTLLLILFMFFFRWIFRTVFYKINHSETFNTKKTRVAVSVLFFLLLGIGIFGRIGQYPLRWSDAQELGSDYKADLAMNPFQSFASTMAFRNNKIDIENVKKHYAELAAYYGVVHPNIDSLQLIRNILPRDTFCFQRPNIVLVICESFSAYKSSMYGNPLNTTPFFNTLCNKGVFFDRCFTPCYGTARGVWAIITGIPDISIGTNTNTRNPAIVSQHTIINDFKDYKKLYFIGGNASWANIRGLLKHNIDNLHLYEEKDYSAAAVDVWGISDKNVFLEANKVLAKQTEPFFSIIQTADNHRPYTIPEEDQHIFKKIHVTKDLLQQYGFESEDELNAFRYTDFCFQQFMETAAKEKYFNNTIFVFVGDHGIRGNATDMFPKAWTEQSLTCQHVPLLFYAPEMLQPRRLSFPCSQLDVLPTIAGLSSISYTNTTMGTDILDPYMLARDSGLHKKVYIFDEGKNMAGTIFQQVLYEKNLTTKTAHLYSMQKNNILSSNDSLLGALGSFTEGWLEWSKYLAYHNKK